MFGICSRTFAAPPVCESGFTQCFVVGSFVTCCLYDTIITIRAPCNTTLCHRGCFWPDSAEVITGNGVSKLPGVELWFVSRVIIWTQLVQIALTSRKDDVTVLKSSFTWRQRKILMMSRFEIIFLIKGVDVNDHWQFYYIHLNSRMT